MLKELTSDLDKLSNPDKAAVLQRFFKTGKGEYAEGDIFLGIAVPVQRNIARKYGNADLHTLHLMLSSRIHEYRLTALLILVNKFNKADESGRKTIYDFYMNNIRHVNNWDLVDLSSEKIAGAFLKDKDRAVLHELAGSGNVWERRISIIATYHFIKNNQFNDTLMLAERLLHDRHDLIHKAAGWMLREVGKRDRKIEEQFLNKHYKAMPRTMLRYAIEKFDEKKRRFYLSKQ